MDSGLEMLIKPILWQASNTKRKKLLCLLLFFSVGLKKSLIFRCFNPSEDFATFLSSTMRACFPTAVSLTVKRFLPAEDVDNFLTGSFERLTEGLGEGTEGANVGWVI